MSRCAVFAVLFAHSAAACVSTGFVFGGVDLTAAMINPASVPEEVDATGCHIGLFFSSGGHRVTAADIHGATYFGIAVVAQSAAGVSVDISGSFIHQIGETPFNGAQHGVAIYYRGFLGSASGVVRGNGIADYQKGGIVLHGAGANVRIDDNVVSGLGPTAFIGQNGIEIAHGAGAHIEGNDVSGNEYTGQSAVSAGILVAGGPAFSPCAPPDGQCAYTTGTHIAGNSLLDNDVGIYLLNLDAAFNPPAAPTRITVSHNFVRKSDGFTNGVFYQAGILDIGNQDVIVANTITGSGYQYPGFAVDADPSFTTRPKVHALR